MFKKRYVGNLTCGVDDAALEQRFSQFGSVQSARVIQDRDTGGSNDFGFVEMSTAPEARVAIQSLNNAEHNDRNLTVSEAKPHDPCNGGGYGSGNRGGYGGGRDRS